MIIDIKQFVIFCNIFALHEKIKKLIIVNVTDNKNFIYDYL